MPTEHDVSQAATGLEASLLAMYASNVATLSTEAIEALREWLREPPSSSVTLFEGLSDNKIEPALEKLDTERSLKGTGPFCNA